MANKGVYGPLSLCPIQMGSLRFPFGRCFSKIVSEILHNCLYQNGDICTYKPLCHRLFCLGV